MIVGGLVYAPLNCVIILKILPFSLEKIFPKILPKFSADFATN